MPFRQLSRTDEGRTESLRQAKQKGDTTPAGELAYSQAMKQELDLFFPDFLLQIQERSEALTKQSEATEAENRAKETLKMLLSQFIQVFNFGIIRGRYDVSDRAYYQLHISQKVLPPMHKTSDVLLWGNNIISGESSRMAAGGVPVLEPNIQEIIQTYNDFVNKHNTQSTLKDKYDKEQEDVEKLRKKADSIIKDVWDEVEFTFRKESPPSKRRKAREYGVIYASRPGEKPELQPAGESNV